MAAKRASVPPAQCGEGGGGQERAILEKDKVGFKPLTEMTADSRYEGQDGGLYGEGKNEPPAERRRVGSKMGKKN